MHRKQYHFKMKFGHIALFLFSLIEASFSQNLSRPTPSSLYSFEFELLDSSYAGQYLSVPIHMKIFEGELGYKVPTPMLLDRYGFVTAYMPNDYRNTMDFRYDPDHDLYSALCIIDDHFTFHVYDTSFKLIDTISNSEGILGDSHEFQIMKNGNYMIGGKCFDTLDLGVKFINDIKINGPITMRGYVIEEFDHAHNLVFQWNSNDHIHPLDGYEKYGFNSADFDYCHGNAIHEDLDGNLLVSFRNLNAIYKIDRLSGDVIWILGGKSSRFTFTNDKGFSGQHDVRILTNGHVTLFDNGNMNNPPVSRAVEYNLDTINWTAKLIWEYKDSCSIFSPAMGNHQTTSDRKHLINYGLTFRPQPSMTLVDDQGKIISNLYLADSVASYRAYAYNVPLYFDRPEVTLTEVQNALILTAPPTHQEYAWSNEADTRSTFVSSAGVYQLWANYGNIMVGSHPVMISDFENIDAEVSVSQNNPGAVIAIYNSLGMEVLELFPNRLYFILYADLTVSKMICHDKTSIIP